MPTKTKAAAPAEGATENADYEQAPEDSTESAESAENAESAESADYEQEQAPEDPPVRLVGQDLLDFYNDRKAAGYSHSDIAHDAGYYTVTKKGQTRSMVAQFNQAFLAAQGHDVGDRPTGPGRSHAGLTKARVSGQGILLVSQLATRKIGANSGAVFSVSYPMEGLEGPGAQILLTLTDEVKPVLTRKRKGEEEQPGTPLLDQAA